MIVNVRDTSIVKKIVLIVIALALSLCLALWLNRSREVSQTDAALSSVQVETERLERTAQRIDKTVKGEIRSNEQKVQGIDVSAAIDELVRAFRKSRDDL